MEKEIWKRIIKYKNQFHHTIRTDIEISNFGNVRGKIFNHIPFTDDMITIINGRKCILHYPIFKWVWQAFHGPVPKGYCIHHKDHNKLNDRLDNLELMTRSEHTIHHNHFKIPWNKGLTKETDERVLNHSLFLSKLERKKGWKHSDNTKNLFSKQRTGRHFFNNGTKNVYTYECPEGFVKGRVPRKK